MERPINAPCANKEERDAEWAALPSDLLNWLRPRDLPATARETLSVIAVQMVASPDELLQPAVLVYLQCGEARNYITIDIALIRKVYEDHGLIGAQAFVAQEVSAGISGLADWMVTNAKAA